MTNDSIKRGWTHAFGKKFHKSIFIGLGLLDLDWFYAILAQNQSHFDGHL
ncbi:hypothetical protein EJK54_0435 [Moraxella catarrhalis]|uniref:Uncharacterized protein n=1 Tax=Moraxella catarrhalis TaxID=480 RepID=A0ABY0BKQ5_MORCA|nr:hypothetical protein EJK54_0435 [Moraxella catarrhalis]